jgi:hypothetical protein
MLFILTSTRRHAARGGCCGRPFSNRPKALRRPRIPLPVPLCQIRTSSLVRVSRDADRLPKIQTCGRPCVQGACARPTDSKEAPPLNATEFVIRARLAQLTRQTGRRLTWEQCEGAHMIRRDGVPIGSMTSLAAVETFLRGFERALDAELKSAARLPAANELDQAAVVPSGGSHASVVSALLEMAAPSGMDGRLEARGPAGHELRSVDARQLANSGVPVREASTQGPLYAHR